MFFQRVKTPGLAHVAYVIGEGNDAVVVDPRRDVSEYLRIARQNDLTIKYVIETHRQEDFVLGSAELARITGAKVVNGRHALFGRGDIRLADGEEFSCGKLRFRALHTPGHTPESMCYAAFVPEAPERAWAAFTGDTLFVGETGRTDLTDRKKSGEHAGLLFDAVHEKIAPLGDQTLVYPAHGSGSVCGGNIAERDESTLGLERLYNPVFKKARADFVRAKIDERIPRPPYFSLMERLNLRGGAPLATPPEEVPVLQPKVLARELGEGIILDARSPEAFAGGHIPGSYSIWEEGLAVFGGWVAQPEKPVFLVLPAMEHLERAVLSLARIGVDNIGGVLAGGFDGWRDAGLPVQRSGVITPKELAPIRHTLRLLDVRDDTEFEREGHVPDASHLYVGYLEKHLDKVTPPLAKTDHVVVTCSVGHRASVAASILRRHGYERVDNLLGGMTAWKALDLPLEQGTHNTVTTPDIEGQRT